MLKIFQKTIPVEVIHAEFDSAQDRILDECDKILTELNIPTETKIVKKAKMLEELGFINSETINQANSFLRNREEIKQKIDITSKQAETIKYFKVNYPNEKFITTHELERICNKYELIHAPVTNYIKDIPEKNVIEMINCKKLKEEDKLGNIYFLSEFNDSAKLMLQHMGKLNNPVFSDQEAAELSKRFGIGIVKDWLPSNNSDSWFSIGGEYYINCYKIQSDGTYPRYKKIIKIDKSGLFIAAPKSHFNLKGLDKKSKFGFFNVTIKEIKDPVVFEYCRDNICRIITKWGTEDDQSYLDEGLINETLN